MSAKMRNWKHFSPGINRAASTSTFHAVCADNPPVKTYAVRSFVVVAMAAFVASIECVMESAGWHGWRSAYYTTPMRECLTGAFPIVFGLMAGYMVWFTRDWTR
jgi:hypothetical protein